MLGVFFTFRKLLTFVLLTLTLTVFACILTRLKAKTFKGAE